MVFFLRKYFCASPARGRLDKSQIMIILASFSVLFFSLFCSIAVAAPDDLEITPFNVIDQGPLVQIYGFPHDSGPEVVSPGKLQIILNQDLTNNSTASGNSREQITLDGETYRLALVARYGVAPRWDIGVEIPYLSQSGGFLDPCINDWHKTFGIQQKIRDNIPQNHLNYSYSQDGVQKLQVTQASSGIGDISLNGGFSLYDARSPESHDRAALKVALKLPSGDSSSLLGSGSTDFSLLLSGSTNRYSNHGTLGVFGSAGALVLSGGDVLSDQQNSLAGLCSFGIGWGPASWLSVKIQLNGHTSLYHNTSLRELSQGSLLLITGGTIKIPGQYLLDLSIAENLSQGTAPDVSFHLGLTRQF